jgi:hypothetical protein
MRLQALVVPAATSDQLPHHHHDQTPQVKSDPIANKTSTIKNRAPSASTTTTTFLLLPTTTTPPSPPPILENYVQESLTTLMVTPHLTDLPHSQCTSFRFWVIPTPSSGQQRYYLSLSLSLSLLHHHHQVPTHSAKITFPGAADWAHTNQFFYCLKCQH